jgi:rhodanese-related sulfurtransferase
VSALQLGYTDVHVMPGGILGWKKAGKPIERSRP